MDSKQPTLTAFSTASVGAGTSVAEGTGRGTAAAQLRRRTVHSGIVNGLVLQPILPLHVAVQPVPHFGHGALPAQIVVELVVAALVLAAFLV